MILSLFCWVTGVKITKPQSLSAEVNVRGTSISRFLILTFSHLRYSSITIKGYLENYSLVTNVRVKIRPNYQLCCVESKNRRYSGDLRYYKSLDTSCNKWLEMIKVGLCHAACRVLQGAAELQSAVSFSAAFHRLDPSSDIANTRPRATTCSGEREEREGNVLSQEELVPDPECFHFYMITASCYIITRAFPPPTPLSLSVVSVVCS